MFYYPLTSFINAATSLTLAIFIFFKNRKSPLHRTFALWAFSVGIWAVSYFVWFIYQIYDDYQRSLFWIRVLMSVINLISISYFHFVISLLEMVKKRKKMLVFGYLLFFVFFILTIFWPHLFVKDVLPKLNFPYWPEPGILFHPFLISWFAYAIYGWYLILKNLKKFTGLKRLRIKYLFIGTFVTYFSGCTNYFLWYDIPIPPVLNILVIVYVLAGAHAVLQYRLFDIQLVIGRILVYSSALGTAVASGFLLFLLNNCLPFSFSPVFVIPFAAFLGALVFKLVFNFYEKIFTRYFYHTFYSYRKVISQLSIKLTAFLDLRKLTSLISKTLIDTMNLDKTGVLIREPRTGRFKIQKIIGFKRENGISLVRDNFLTQYLEKEKSPLVYEELKFAIEDTHNKEIKGKLEKLQANMKRIEARICLPLLSKEKIIGILVLGEKKSKNPYSRQDVELLMNLSNQASIAIENAKLYSQVQDLSLNLKKKVAEQTKEIRNAYKEIKKSYEIEKRARQELQRLDKVKNQFMITIQHHLRTPLSSMKACLCLILEGLYGKVPEKIKEMLEKFGYSAESMIKTVEEFLDISQFQLGKKIVSLTSNVRIEPIIEEIIEELSPIAKEKKTYLKLRKAQHLPSIKGDPEKLKVCFSNIIDNAVRYTEKGGVTVKIQNLKSKIQIIIEDTGIGISKEDLSKMFTRTFERSEKSKELFATGKGIGLYITSIIIEAHKGKIWAESKGRGRGSAFYIELPVEKNKLKR